MIKRFNKFNESTSEPIEMSKSESDDISWSISDWWVSVDDYLPMEGQHVIVYLGNYNQSDNKISICTFRKGISKKERELLKETDPERYRTYSDADEHNNNWKPYRWKCRGPGSYFGQDVTHWMPEPQKPI